MDYLQVLLKLKYEMNELQKDLEVKIDIAREQGVTIARQNGQVENLSKNLQGPAYTMLIDFDVLGLKPN